MEIQKAAQEVGCFSYTGEETISKADEKIESQLCASYFTLKTAIRSPYDESDDPIRIH